MTTTKNIENSQKITVKLPKISQVDFEIIIHEEDLRVQGNAIASGDDDFDRKVENEILDRLNNGDLWAWCTVEVKASWKGLEASDYLGACSYKNERGFKTGGYYKDMKNIAFGLLTQQIQSLAK